MSLIFLWLLIPNQPTNQTIPSSYASYASFRGEASAQTGPLKVPEGFKQASLTYSNLIETQMTKTNVEQILKARIEVLYLQTCGHLYILNPQVEKGKPMYYNDKRQVRACDSALDRLT